MLLYAFVILFTFSIFLNVCIYSIYRFLTYSFSYFLETVIFFWDDYHTVKISYRYNLTTN